MSEARVILPGSHRKPAPGAEILGPANPADQISVTVYVRGKDDPLPILSPGHYITSEEYTAAYGASANDFLAVIDFAKEYNLRAGKENPETRSIELHGAIADMSRAFGVTLNQAKINDKVFRHREGEISIPEKLLPIVRAVIGLDDRPQGKPHVKRFEPKTVEAALAVQSFSPLNVGKLYNFPPSLDGTGTTIAIMEFGGGFLQSDLTTFFGGLGLSVPSITAASVNGGKNNVPSGSAKPTPEESEVALDIQVAGSLAPGAKQVVYFAPSFNPKNLLDTLNAAIDGKPQPIAISMSWGNPEENFTSQFMVQYDTALNRAALKGIPVTVASGDQGSFDEPFPVTTTAKTLRVDFPAAAPHALACGGTTLEASGNTITSEIVWSSTDGNGDMEGSGGGVSQTFGKPTYQSSVTVPLSPAGKAGRGVPDVAGDADPNSGYQIVVKGKKSTVGGTSAVSPLYAALIARCGQSLGKPVGFLHTLIYQSKVNSKSFRDITQGSNDSEQKGGLYKAGTGWDASTGFGSPNGVELLNALKAGSTSGTGTTGTTGTGHTHIPFSGPTPPQAPPPFEYPVLPPPVPAPPPAFPTLPSLPPALGNLLSGGSNSVAIVGVVGLAAVVGLVAATGIVATVAIAKDKE